MYNNYAFNESIFNETPAVVPTTQDSIVFDGYSLQNANIITSKINYDDQGQIELNSFNYPRVDGGWVLSKFYRGRIIVLNCTIKADTATAFNTLLDTTKKNLRKTEGYLEITVNSEIRRIKATLKSFDVSREHYNVNFVPVTIEFEALEPFFYTLTDQGYVIVDTDNSREVEQEMISYSERTLAVKTLAPVWTMSTWDVNQQATGNVNGIGFAITEQYYAQSFVPTKRKFAWLVFQKQANTGTPTSTVTVAICTNNAGSPSTTVLGSVTISSATWNAIADGAEYTVYIPLDLTVWTTYWIRFYSSTADNLNYRKITRSTTGSGVKYSQDASTWTSPSARTIYHKTLYYKPCTTIGARVNGQTVEINADSDWFLEGTTLDLESGVWTFTDSVNDNTVPNNMYMERSSGCTFSSNTVQFSGSTQYYKMKVNFGLPCATDMTYSIGFITNNTISYSYDDVTYYTLGTLVSSGGSFTVPTVGRSQVYIKNTANANWSMTSHSGSAKLDISGLAKLYNYPTGTAISKTYTKVLSSPTTSATYRANKFWFPAIEYSNGDYQFLDIDPRWASSVVQFSEDWIIYTTVADGANIALTSTQNPMVFTRITITVNRVLLWSDDLNNDSDKDSSRNQTVGYYSNPTTVTNITSKWGMQVNINTATWDVARTTSGWIENEKHGLYATNFANSTSFEFDTAVTRTWSKTLKVSTTDVTWRARVYMMPTIYGTLTDTRYIIPAKASTKYQVNCWAKTNNVATNGVSLALDTYVGAAYSASYASQLLTGTNDWTLLTIQITTGATIDGMAVSFFNGTAWNISDAWFDIDSMTIEEVVEPATGSTGVTTIRLGDTVRNYIYQKFEPLNAEITGFYIRKWANTGSFTGDVALKIRSDSSGNPWAILTTVTIPNATWNAITTNVDYYVRIPATLSTSLSYWLEISSSTSDASNYTSVYATTYTEWDKLKYSPDNSYILTSDFAIYHKITFEGTSERVYWEVNHEWTARSNPKFYISGKSLCEVTSFSLTYEGKIMTINTTIAESDIIIIDSETKTVTKNGTEIDYTWVFPVFEPGTNSYYIDFTWVAVVDIQVTLKKNYL